MFSWRLPWIALGSSQLLDEHVTGEAWPDGTAKPLHLKVDVCWATTLDEALSEAHGQCRFNALGSGVNWDIRLPAVR